MQRTRRIKMPGNPDLGGDYHMDNELKNPNKTEADIYRAPIDGWLNLAKVAEALYIGINKPIIDEVDQLRIKVADDATERLQDAADLISELAEFARSTEWFEFDDEAPKE
jgi:hypothetical protein